MLIRHIKTFILILTIGLFGPTKADYDQCKGVLDWIYRDLTLNNLELSYDRAMNKFLLGLHTVHKNTKDSKKYKRQMAKIFHRLKIIDPKLKPIIDQNKSIQKRSWFLNWRLKDEVLKKSTLQAVISEWKDLQDNSPELFDGLDENLKIDSWDTFTIDLLTNISKYGFENKTLKQSLKTLGQKFKKNTTSLLTKQNFNPDELRQRIKSTHKKMLETLNKGYSDILYDFRNICSPDEMKIVLENEKAFCPMPDNVNFKDLSLKLFDLQSTIKDSGLLEKDFPGISGPNIDINFLKYKVNNDPEVTFCKRSPEMVSMIVIHHTQTKNNATPHDINTMHLNRPKEGEEPWYMMGYNYIISSNFQGAIVKSPKVFQGRPPEIQGAHAGGKMFEVKKSEREFFKNKKISCGKPNSSIKEKMVLDKADEDGGLKGNFHSYGVAIIGNYAPMSVVEVAGVSTPTNFIPDFQETPSQGTIDAVAKLSCDLQKKNKRITKIVPHSYFKSTDCPGNLVDALVKIKTAANKILGCEFTVELQRGDGKWQ